jgi:hypothetical protein
VEEILVGTAAKIEQLLLDRSRITHPVRLACRWREVFDKGV